MKDKKLLIGLNVGDTGVIGDSEKHALVAENGKNVDFYVCHMDAMRHPMPEAIEQAKTVSEKLAAKGIEFIANFEWQNGHSPALGPDGYDWAGREDGTHRLRLPEEYVSALKSGGMYTGMIYDEFEHVIINNNAAISRRTKGKVRVSAFPHARTGGALEQGRLLDRQLGEYLSELREAGVENIASEHVFPVLYHLFAKNGIIPNFKSQKESYTTVQFAIAAGAALQYGMPLFNCIDLWFMDFFPGHSASEMEANLEFAYLAGVNRVYVENASPMVKDGKLTDYGEAFYRFSSGHKGRERAYDIEDYTPETGIIRFDDTHWGASGILWKKILFGNKRLRPSRASREYIRVFHLLTHGETNKNGINWGRLTLWSLKKHRSFSSMNNAAVFDENVRRKTLESLKTVFLTGEYISPETLSDVEALVRENGLTAVTTKRFLPKRLLPQKKFGVTEIADGKGKWIVTPGFLRPALRKKLCSVLGNKGEIRLTFGKNEVCLKISEDGNGFTRK